MLLNENFECCWKLTWILQNLFEAVKQKLEGEILKLRNKCPKKKEKEIRHPYISLPCGRQKCCFQIYWDAKTQSGSAHSAQVPGHHQEQLSQTLIMRSFSFFQILEGGATLGLSFMTSPIASYEPNTYVLLLLKLRQKKLNCIIALFLITAD